MKDLVVSPMIESIRCSSCEVPRVAMTSACVSPRVKTAEPCVRGSTPHLAGDVPDVRQPTAVDPLPLPEDRPADELLFQAFQGVGDQRPLLRALLVGEGGPNRLADRIDPLAPVLLFLDGVRLPERAFGDRRDLPQIFLLEDLLLEDALL